MPTTQPEDKSENFAKPDYYKNVHSSEIMQSLSSSSSAQTEQGERNPYALLTCSLM